MNNWAYIAGGLCLLLFCFLVWKEITRPNKARRIWRLLATTLAVASLYLLAVPLMYTGNETIHTSNDAILLTDGADIDSLSKFLSVTNKSTPVFTLDENIAGNTKYHASLIIDQNDIIQKKFRALHVFGYGVEKDEWKSQPLIFHPSPLPTGITFIHWQPVIAMGEKLVIQGRLHNSGSAPVKMALIAYNKAVDSFVVPGANDQLFQLGSTPKQLGRAVYSIALLSGKDTITQEPVPLQVMQAAPLKILLLSSSPDFENKFLKNWLAEKGYEVVTRTTISKNKTGKEYLNTAQVNVDQLTTGLLDQFDIILADAGELNSLSGGEVQSLRSAISEKGKGLIIRADSAAQRTLFYTSLFPTAQADTVAQHSLNLTLLSSNSALQPLSVSPTVFIRPQPGTQPLVSDKENHVLAGSAILSSGKIVMSTLPNTFSWMLSGNQDDYTNVWSELITNVAPKKTSEESWYVSPARPKQDEAAMVSLEANSSVMPVAQVGGASVYLSAHPDLSFLSHGSYWPVMQGWQAGIQLNGGAYYWYAYGKKDWLIVSAAQKQRNTQQLSSAVIFDNEAGKPAISTQQQKAAPKIIFFLLFLAACGYLWFENKYYNS